MVKGTFKQIDLLRKRRDSNFLLDPYFIDNKKFIKKGIYLGSTLIIASLFIGIGFIFRTNILEQKKSNIKNFADEYDSLVNKLDKESIELKKIAEFNRKLKNSITNIYSSSAFFKEISLLVPKGMQLTEINLENNQLSLKSKVNHKRPIEIVNAFLIRLDDSEFINFNEIDLDELKTIENDSEDEIYEVVIKSNISNNFAEINQKYLEDLGSFGLANRIKNLNKIFENKI